MYCTGTLARKATLSPFGASTILIMLREEIAAPDNISMQNSVSCSARERYYL